MNPGGFNFGEHVPMIVLGLLVLSVVFSLLGGLRKGIKKQALHTVCTIEAAVMAYLIVSGITQVFVDSFSGETIADLLASVGINADTAKYLDGAVWLLALPVATILVPILFIIFFAIVKIFAGIMYFIMKKVLSLPKKESGAANRCGGMVVGAAEGLICFIIFAMPFAGILGIFDSGVEELRAKDESAYSEFFDFYDKNINPLADSFAVKTVNALGGDAVLDSFATVEKDGNRINLRREVVDAVSVVTELSTMKDVNWKAMSKEHQAVLNSAVDTLEESKYLSVIMSSLLRGMASAVESGVVPIQAEAPFDGLINSVVALFATSDENNIAGDIDSILSVYYIFCDERVLEVIEGGDSDAMLNLLTTERDGTTIVKRIIAALKENEHTRPLVASLTELSVNIMAGQMSDQLGGGENSAEIYQEVKEGIKDVLAIKPTDYPDTEEGKVQYKEALTESLDTTLKDNGIELEPEIVGGIADYIDENIEVKDEYSDEEINDIILSYYDVYVDYLNNGTLPDGVPAPQ